MLTSCGENAGGESGTASIGMYIFSELRSIHGQKLALGQALCAGLRECTACGQSVTGKSSVRSCPRNCSNTDLRSIGCWELSVLATRVPLQEKPCGRLIHDLGMLHTASEMQTAVADMTEMVVS